jgi:hypothetical protein
MRADTTPWRNVPLAGDYGRPARATWRGLDWAGYEHDLAVAGSRLHYLDYTAGHRRGGTSSSWRTASAASGSIGQRTSPRSAREDG